MATQLKERQLSDIGASDFRGPVTARVAQMRCAAFNRRGQQCGNRARPGMAVCATHTLRISPVETEVAEIESEVAAIELQDRPRRSMSVSAAVAWVAGGLMAAAGVIHLAFAPDHIKEYLPFGIAFYVMGVGQLGGAVAVGLWKRSRRVLFAAVLANVGLCALWLVTRTVGLPIGATPWTAEKIGVADSVCVAFQLTLAGLLGFLLARRPAFSRLRGRRIGFITAAAVMTVFALVLVPLTVHASHTGHESGGDMAPATAAMPANG